jgi:hypothetical protein
MTTHLTTHLRILAAGFARAVQEQRPSSRQRAQETPGVEPHPQPCVRMKKAHKQSHHRQGQIIRRFLHDWFTAYSALSPVIGFFVTVIPEKR